jgi:NAD(P)-dependent dehydrogenase (short-subunit alcohol dehydrogenase family)
MGKFDGKIALIGGNLGYFKKEEFFIGLGGMIAKELASQGAQVFLVDLDFKITKACAAKIDGKCRAMECDLLKDRTYEVQEQMDEEKGKMITNYIWKDHPALALVEEIVKECGKLDILITNFDTYEKARVDSSDDALYTKLRDENIMPVFHLLSAVREQFAHQTRTTGTFAKVVMITSFVGKAGLSVGSLYAAFKGSIVGLTKSMAREFARFANVNCVATGPFAEKRLQGPKDNIKSAYMPTQTELSNLDLKIEHIVPMVLLLASDDAMAIDGQIISIDAGLWLKLEQ